MSTTSTKPPEGEEVSDMAVHSGKEPPSGKVGRKQDKKDVAGEGSTLTPKKEKKLKGTASGTGRVKNKPPAQTVQAPADTEGSAAFLLFTLLTTATVLYLPSDICECLDGAVVGRRTRDRKVADSTPVRGTIKSTRSTQPSIPPWSVNRVPACVARVRCGTFTCVRWQVTLCDPICQLTSHSSEMGFP